MRYLSQKLLSVFAAATFATAVSAFGQLVVTNAFEGSYSFAGQTNSSSVAYNGVPIDDLTPKPITKVNVTSSAAADRFMASGWSTNSFSATNYFEFSLTATPRPGVPFSHFDLSTLEFALRRSSTGPRQFEWRSSVDSFASTLTNFSLVNPNVMLANGILTLPDSGSTTTYSGNTLSFSGPSFLGLSSITLRLYAYQAESSAGIAGLDTPLTFKGLMTAPEPSSLALLGLSGLLVSAWLLRNRRA